MITLSIGRVDGLLDSEQEMLNDLVSVYNYHLTKNNYKEKYYEGHISLSDVNLGIALPNGIRSLSVGCDWGAKCVDVLAGRSMFDGFVSSNGWDSQSLSNIINENNLIAQYNKACKDELKFGCTFATLSAGGSSGCQIKFHSPMQASALWDGVNGRIKCGMAIMDAVPDEKDESTWTPSRINLYTDNFTFELIKTDLGWTAKRYVNPMGRPLMEPLIWNGTSSKPFGRSRLKAAVRALIDGYVRTIANASIALEFDTTPQKYILGVTDDQYDAIISDKFKQYVGSLIAATTNPETGSNPTFGQLQQGNLSPHIEMIRLLATQFSAATGLSVTDTGVINDANPTSSDAILAQSQTLVILAEQLNTSNGDSLRTIALMALAISQDKTVEKLTSEEKSIVAHFGNPAMPSLSSTADAAVKIASARPEFASTDTFLEMIGFDQASIRRIKAQETRARGQSVLSEVE